MVQRGLSSKVFAKKIGCSQRYVKSKKKFTGSRARFQTFFRNNMENRVLDLRRKLARKNTRVVSFDEKYMN